MRPSTLAREQALSTRLEHLDRLGTRLRDDVAALLALDDVSLGSWLLQATATNEHRDTPLIRDVSARAQDFGRRLALAPREVPEGRLCERRDGLDRPDPLLARYSHRTGTVELFLDTVEFCEQLLDRLGWRAWFPAGSVRASAIAHEDAHHLIGHHHAKALREAVAVPALTLFGCTRWAHVAGAEELAAHACAQQRLGLIRSPLLVTAAAMAALDLIASPHDDVVKES